MKLSSGNAIAKFLRLSSFFFLPKNWQNSIFIRARLIGFLYVYQMWIGFVWILSHSLSRIVHLSWQFFSVSFPVQTSTHKQKWRRNAINLSSVELKCICHKVLFSLCALVLPTFSHHTTLIQINDLTRLECFEKYCRTVVALCTTFSCNLSEMVQLNAIKWFWRLVCTHDSHSRWKYQN